MRLPASLLGLLLAAACSARTPITVPANAVIPQPPPSADIALWKPEGNRSTVILKLGSTVLHGFRYAGTDPKAPILLFFNGNSGTIAAGDSIYRQLASLGPTVVVYDYRGYGFTPGSPDLMTYRSDALAIYDSLAAAFPGHSVMVYGFSMGSAMAAYIANQRKVTGLILAGCTSSALAEFPFFARAQGYSADFIATHTPGPDSELAFGEAVLIARSHAPLLILHAANDMLIPVEQARAVFAASPSVHKRLVILSDVSHSQTPDSPAAFAAVGRFLCELRR